MRYMPNVTQSVVAVLGSLSFQLAQTFINAKERNVPVNLISYFFAGRQSPQLVKAPC